MKLYNSLTGKYSENNYDLSDVYVKYHAIPKEQNAKMVFENFEVILGLDGKIPLFTVTDGVNTLVSGSIIPNEYVKSKMIKKMSEENYTDEVINSYKDMEPNTIVYVSQHDEALKFIDMFITVLQELEIK